MDTSVVAGWLLTFAAHSTVLLGAAWLLARALRGRHEGLQEWVWKFALLAPLLSASVPLPGLQAPPLTLPALRMPAIPVAPQPAATTAPEALTPAQPNAPEQPPITRAVDLPAWLVAAALALCALATATALRSRARLHRTLRTRTPVVDPVLHQVLDELLRATRSRLAVRLTWCAALRSPIAFGVWHPEICVPLGTGQLDRAWLRSLLAHELAHLRARDPLWLALQTLLRCLFPWQLLLRSARHHLRELAEYRCDAWAAQEASHLAMAQCLVQVADWLGPTPVPDAVAGMAMNGSVLGSRVERLLAGRPVERLGRARFGLVPVLVLVLALMAAMPRAGFAGPTPARSDAALAATPATPLPTATEPTLADEFRAVAEAVALLQQELDGVEPDAELDALLQRLHLQLARLEQHRRQLSLGSTTAPDAAPELASPRKDR